MTSTWSSRRDLRARRSGPTRSGLKPKPSLQRWDEQPASSSLWIPVAVRSTGQKISVQAKDAIGRTHQISTIQLDFQMPNNFDITYVAPDNTRQRPIMIHRALFGSVERFMAILIEHYAGNLPTWLCPEQVRVLGVRNDHDDYAYEVAALLRERGLRTHVEDATEPLGLAFERRNSRRSLRGRGGRRRRRPRHARINARGSNDPQRGVKVGEFAERVANEVVRHASPEAP